MLLFTVFDISNPIAQTKNQIEDENVINDNLSLEMKKDPNYSIDDTFDWLYDNSENKKTNVNE